jgi:hypothetical protein
MREKIDKNLLYDSLNIRKRELFVKGFLAGIFSRGKLPPQGAPIFWPKMKKAEPFLTLPLLFDN